MQQTYTYLSIVVGLLQVYDGYTIYVDRGRISTFAMTFSLFEYVWAGVSIYLIYKCWGLSISALWYPMLFIFYLAVAMFWGIMAFKDYEPTSTELPVMSPSMVIAGTAFGGLFAICGIYQAMMLS
jgi:hypothetical protein